jgi:hypothetical protein
MKLADGSVHLCHDIQEMASAQQIDTPAVLPLFNLVADGRSMPLAQPLTLRVSIEEGVYFVENDTLRLFGKGASLDEAVQAFQRDLVYYWRYYRSLSEDDVAGAGVELKKTYDTLVTV